MKLIDIYLTGKPCAGKDVASSYISSEFGFKHFRSGSIMKKKYEKDFHDDKETMRKFLEGALENDEENAKYIIDYINLHYPCNLIENKILIYDGFPRTNKQLEIIHSYNNDRSNSTKILIILDISDEKAIQRSIYRFICQVCNTSLHPENKEEVVISCKYCCSTSITKREDDSIENIKKRLENYYIKTQVLENTVSDSNLNLHIYKIKADNITVKELQLKLNEIIIKHYGS